MEGHAMAIYINAQHDGSEGQEIPTDRLVYV